MAAHVDRRRVSTPSTIRNGPVRRTHEWAMRKPHARRLPDPIAAQRAI
jgi:hypothetical protein